MKVAAFSAVLAAGALAAGAASASQVFNVEVWLQGTVASASNFADPGHVPGGPASVTFDWTGPINWSDTSPQNSTSAGGKAGDLLDGYTTQLTNYATTVAGLSFADFLNRSLTISGDGYTTFFRLSTSYTSANAINGTFTHDDGATIYVDGNLAGGSAPETSQVTQAYSLPGGGGVHNLNVYYVTGNGTPSILSFDPQVTTFSGGVPEPATWALMIMGFGAAGAMMRRKRALALVRA
jgi:hypothetical protein